ncbi:polyprenol monophosphomannose synthase [candidate division CSSED10-310 bacterium]|uniref:Polyprenol monophosphomannose synthase n=1 Tax=candidate division CSSED10-310 bacterium TaxID=2855610 RepID=A0ABV6YTA8_UNCC1
MVTGENLPKSRQAPFIIIPTYNEKDNITPLIQIILALNPRYRIIVIDDDSPDGTHAIVEKLAREEPRIFLLHRIGVRGRGTAGIAGFQRALAEGAEAVVEMDADFSHNPEDIPRLFENLSRADVAIGSRMVAGGGETGRAMTRQRITKIASFFIRSYLRIPVLDPTSGFRAFRAEALQKIPWDQLQSQGPSIVEELLYYLHRMGCSIEEISIQFQERNAGTSTFNLRILIQTLWFVLLLPFKSTIPRA